MKLGVAVGRWADREEGESVPGGWVRVRIGGLVEGMACEGLVRLMGWVVKGRLYELHASTRFAEGLEGGEGVEVDWIFHAAVAEAAFVLFVDGLVAVITLKGWNISF